MTTTAVDDTDDDPRRPGVRLLQDSTLPSENWDDDFEFQAGAAPHTRDSGHDAMHAPVHPVHSHEREESWDDAYEDDDAHSSPIKRAPKIEDDDVEDWDSSDNELEPNDEDNNHRHDQGREFGLGGFEEEDRTVTARSTSSRPPDVPPALPLPIPPSHPGLCYQAHTVLPTSTTSPTLSTFSIPLSSTTRDHASIYSQDRLMPSSSSSAPHLSVMRSYPHAAGSTPPRKGRRLRKKSRPPEADIFELEDREPDSPLAPLPPPPITVPPPDKPSPVTPPRAQQITLESPLRTTQPSAPPTPSPSLLTRIGSFKRWARRSMGPDDPAMSGWRRGKSSTGPVEANGSPAPDDPAVRGGKSSIGPDLLAEEQLDTDARTVSPTPAPGYKARRSRGDSASGQKSGWFFRAGGAAGVERDELNPSARTPELSPTKRGTMLGLRRRNQDRAEEGEEIGEETSPTPRKAKGKLISVSNLGEPSRSHKQAEPTSPTRSFRKHSPRDGDESQPHRGSRPMSTIFPRHGSASVGRNAGMPLSVSISAGAVLSHSAEEEQEQNVKKHGGTKEREGGMRGLLNGVRRLSLVGPGHVHKRTKSTGGDAGAAEAVRNDILGRPRSGTEQRPGAKPEPPALRVSTSPTAMHRGEGNGLLPAVDLELPLSGPYARRGSLPWADYDPSSVAESSTGLSSVQSSYRMPLNPGRTQQQLPAPNRQSFSASASSLLAGSPARSSRSGSPTRPARSSTAPVMIPVRPDAPPRTRAGASGTHAEQRSEPTFPSKPPVIISSSPPVSSQAQALSQTPATSAPQSASLGRSTTSPSHMAGLRRNSLGDLKTPMNTLGEHKAQLPPLGELKIPARISRAQQGLRRDLGLVREFAGCVEQLKRLQATYTTLIGDLRAAYEASPVSPVPMAAHVQFHLPSRPPSQTGISRKTITNNSNSSVQSIQQTMCLNSPTKLHPARSFSRASHDTNPDLARLEHEYAIWWECAELLVELGGGTGTAAGTASNPNLSTRLGSNVDISTQGPSKEPEMQELPIFLRPTNHASSMSEPDSLFAQAIPVASNSNGPPQASPPHPSQWRASTGRHDLSARQLRLLKDMLNTPDPASLAQATGPYGHGAGYPPPYPYAHPYLATETPPWAAWNPSSLTLPSEESSADTHGHSHEVAALNMGVSESKEKKRRVSKLGMLGLREILRGLKRNALAEGTLGRSEEPTHEPQRSESSMSSSTDDDHYNRRRSPWHQHDEHHAAKQSTGPEATVGVNHPPTRVLPPKSPRRPSLATIFRIGHKSTKNAVTNGRHKDAPSSGSGSKTPEDQRPPDPTNGVLGEYSDWERMSRSDLDLPALTLGSGTATVRGKKATKAPTPQSDPNLQDPYSLHTVVTTPTKTPATSQTSFWESSVTSPQPSRLPLSIAEEDGGLRTLACKTPVPPRPKKERTSSWSQAHPPPRPTSRNGKAAISGTVRSAPPTEFSSTPDLKLALTPENIKPLLEYAKEVSTRLADCIGEVQTLLSATVSAKVS